MKIVQTYRLHSRFILLLFMLIAFTAALTSQEIAVDRNGVAVQGYDVVAYFTMNDAVRGSREYQADHDGATYFFSSEEHLDLFVADPEAYVPQYGGWCSYAVSRGYTARIRPAQFTIYDGRLFLNFSRGTRMTFESNLSFEVQRADENWPDVRAELAN